MQASPPANALSLLPCPFLAFLVHITHTAIENLQDLVGILTVGHVAAQTRNGMLAAVELRMTTAELDATSVRSRCWSTSTRILRRAMSSNI